MVACDFTPIVDRQLFSANQKIENQNFIGAAKDLESIIDSSNDKLVRSRVLVQLAQLYAYHLNDLKRAIKLIKRSIRITSDPIRLIKYKQILADIYFTNLRDFSSSAPIYEELLGVRPKLPQYSELKFRYAESLYMTGLYNKALDAFRNLQISYPGVNKSKIQFRIGTCMYFLKKYDDAEEVFKRIVDNDFSYTFKVKSAFYLAGIYEEFNELDKAYKFYSMIRYDYPNKNLIERKIESVARKRVEVGL